jgi:hypothetical protein
MGSRCIFNAFEVILVHLEVDKMTPGVIFLGADYLKNIWMCGCHTPVGKWV